MKISVLSRETGVPVATIKYYLREGLLPKGEATAATQAQYGPAHVQRIRLIRALLEVGALPISAIREILEALDDPGIELHDLLGIATYALVPHVVAPDDDPEWDRAESDVAAFLAERGWRVEPDAPARRQLAQAIKTLRRLGMEVDAPGLTPYADAADAIARHEMSSLPSEPPTAKDTSEPTTAKDTAERTSAQTPSEGETGKDGASGQAPNEGEAGANDAAGRAGAVEWAVVGSVLYEQVLLAMRRLAQEDASARLTQDPPSPAPRDT